MSDRRRVRSRKPPNLMRQRVSNFNQARMDAFEFSHLAVPLTSLNASGRDASEMCRVRDGSVPFIISQIYVYLCVCVIIYTHIYTYKISDTELVLCHFCEMSYAFCTLKYFINNFI